MRYITNYDVKSQTLHIIRKVINDDYLISNCGITLINFLPYDNTDINIFKFPKCKNCFKRRKEIG